MKGYKLHITKHCKLRAKQRLRLFLRPFELDDIEGFIRKEFELAHKPAKLYNCPFYKNRGGSEVFETKFVKFYGIIEGDTIILRTVVKNRGEWRY